MSIASDDRPAPWQLELTRFDESLGSNSLTRVVAANGRHVITIGDGNPVDKALHERIAAAIVAAANCAGGEVPRVRFVPARSNQDVAHFPFVTEDAGSVTVREIDRSGARIELPLPQLERSKGRKRSRYDL